VELGTVFLKIERRIMKSIGHLPVFQVYEIVKEISLTILVYKKILPSV